VERGLWSAITLDLEPPEEGRRGDPGLFGPGSAVWRIGRERVLLAGGPAALLLQIAHPLVAAGVAAHSDFRRDPFHRLRATLDATLRISFGDADQVRSAASAVEASHRRVRGRLGASVGPFPAGSPYDATDPELAMWVHATLVWAALSAYQLLVRPLAPGDAENYYEEAKSFARLFCVTDGVLPAGYDDFRSYFLSMVEGPTISVGEQAQALAREVLHPPLPAVLAPLAATLNVITAGLLPEPVRAGFGLHTGTRERMAIRAVATSTRAAGRALPSGLRYWPHYRTAVHRMRGS
jgi:uncharacterized protein (DUF2236 family)